MSKRVLFVLGAVLPAMMNGCAGQTEVRAIPSAESTIAEAPTYKVGEEWRLIGGAFPAHVRVVAVEGDQIVTEFAGHRQCLGCRYYRDTNLTVVKVVGPDGKPATDPAAALGLLRLNFPLSVGKTWRQEVEPYQALPGQVARYAIRYKVEAYEAVTVKAGTFNAFRISRTDQNLTHNLPPVTQVYWYAPEARWYIKFVGGVGSGDANSELESFTLK